MDWLAVLATVVAILGAVFSGAWFFGYQHYHRRLDTSAGKRLEAAQMLFAPNGWAYYLAWLRRILNNLDRWMGTLDEVGRLFSRCVMLAFMYPFVFLIISWLVSGSATIGSAELMLPSGSLSIIERFFIALGLVAFAFASAAAFVYVTTFISTFVTSIIGIFAGAFAGAGARAGAGAGAFFLAITSSRAVAIAVAIVVVLVYTATATAITITTAAAAVAAAVAAVLAFAFVGPFAFAFAIAFASLFAFAGAFIASQQGVPLADPRITSWLLFLVLLPPINAVFDWASWWASRALGRSLVSTLEQSEVTTWQRVRTLLSDMLVDIVIAIFLLTMLAYFMPRLIDAWNWLVVMLEGGEAPINLVDYLCAAARNPLTDGLWATLMLFSTLIPTIGHLGMLIMAFFIRSPSQANRERAAHLRHQYRPPSKDIKGLGDEGPEKWPVMPYDYSIEHINGPDAVPMDALNVDTVNAVSWNLGVFRWFWYLLAVSAVGALVYWVVTPILFYPWEPLPKLLLVVAGFTWPEAQACFLEAG